MQSATAILTGNLPAEPNSFIGRERDLAELARLLGEVRALTLSGPGGIGKTRLAVRLARDVLSGDNPDADEGPRDLDEAWLVELAGWRGPAGVHADQRQHRVGGPVVPDTGRDTAGHRAVRGPGAGAVGGADRGPAARPVPAAELGRPDGAAAPADAAGHRGLEL